jgi:hypothetical protein
MENKDKNDSFVFYRSFYEAWKILDKDDKITLMEAICEYCLNEKQASLKGINNVAWKLIRPQLDATAKRYEKAKNGGKKGAPHGVKGKDHGSKGGRPKNSSIEQNQIDTEKKTPLNYNYNGNANYNGNSNENTNVDNGHTPSSCDEVPKDYSFEGKTIRLTSGDYKQWLSQFTYLNSEQLIDELQLADVYYTENPPKNNKWFFPVYNWLKKANASQRETEASEKQRQWNIKNTGI